MKKNIIFSILAILLAFLFFLPTIIKNYAIKNSKELLGRQIGIGSLKYNYFTSTVQVYDFNMFEQNEKDNFVTLDTLLINLQPLKLIDNQTVIQQFYINGLSVNTKLKDSVFNFDDLITFFNSPEETKEQKKNTKENLLQYKISNIELKNANFYFDNKNVESTTSIEKFSCAIPFIGWDQEQKSNADIKFNFEDGGYFHSKLNINPINGDFDANIILKDLLLNPFHNYIKDYAEINSINGYLSSDINLNGNTKEIEKLLISGKVDVYDFKMTDSNDKEFLKAKHVSSSLSKIDYNNNAFIIDTLKFNEPYVFFKMDSITNNFFQIFKIDTEKEVESNEVLIHEEKNTGTNTTLYYAINKLITTNGILDYSDNLTGNEFDYHLSEIKLESKDIKSDAENINIFSEMLLNERGTLKAKLGFNPNDYKNLDLDLTIENFLLSDINIYSKYYMGHNILNGDFYYYSKSKITNGAVKSENKLLVKNVSVSNEKGGLYKLPLKFALFLLKDKNGDVNLDIPVRGYLNDPKVRIGKIIWNTFKNLIKKTAASSVNVLASLVGANPKEFEEIKFRYTEAVPNQKQTYKLDKLLEMETKKEGLKIKLTHFADPKIQRESFAFIELGKQFFFETSKDYLNENDEFEKYLRNKVGNDTINIKDAVTKLTNIKIIDSLVDSSNTLLVENVLAYLKTKKDSTNISVLKSEKQDPKNTGSESVLKITYEMLEE